MSALEFRSWARPELVHTAIRQASGRLGRDLSVTLVDSAAGAAPPADIRVEFRSAVDVGTLAASAIRRRVPAPGSTDAETTKCPHVEFAGPDLPWRYTPEGEYKAHPEQVRPWLALIVGAAGQVEVAGETAVISATVLKDYPLGESWRWAHVHTPAGDPDLDVVMRSPLRVSRLLSLRPLQPLTLYTAVLVPTFDSTGADAWSSSGGRATGGKPLRALASWTFMTGEGGDFETLAAQLRMPPSGDIGKAALTYSVGSPSAPDEIVGPVDVRGALASLAAVRDAPAASQSALAKQMAELVRAAAAKPEVLGPPDYGVPWVADPTAHAAGWMQQLREDARVRIHAGTGVWTGVEAQDELMRAAVEQTGSLPEAAAKIARAAAGLVAATAQWERALPADALGRLTVLAPMTARLPVLGSTDTVADAVTGPDRALDAGLFSGAGTRLLGRPGRAHRERGHGRAEMLTAANTPRDDMDEARHRLEPLWAEEGILDFLDRVWKLLLVWADGRTDEAEALIDAGVVDCDVREIVAFALGESDWDDTRRRFDGSPAAAELVYGPVQTAVLRCLLRCGERAGEEEARCRTKLTLLRIPKPYRRRPIDLDRLSGAVAGTVDPRGTDSPARRRLREEITGLPVDSLAPPRYPLGLDFPTWTLLRRYEPDWLLPGAQTLPNHSLIALQTNPEFIDAFLVGLNTQFLTEVRWRGLQVDRWGTPLRMFFGPADPTGDGAGSAARLADIIPIDEWDDDSALGARSHQVRPPGAAGDGAAERLVVLLHTPLFRRYPATLVYLQKLHGDEEIDELVLLEGPRDLNPPAGATPTKLAEWYRERTFIGPTFTGTLNADLVFFVFDISPSDLDGFALVLEEPKLELRFRNDLPAGQASAAEVAAGLVDSHTRVAISGRYLEQQGGGL